MFTNWFLNSLIPTGIELVTVCVWSRCDNHYTIESQCCDGETLYFVHFSGFYWELATAIEFFWYVLLVSCYQKVLSSRSHRGSCSFVRPIDLSSMFSVSNFSRATVFFVEQPSENFPRLSRLTIWGSELPNFVLCCLIGKSSFFSFRGRTGLFRVLGRCDHQ